MTGFNSKRQMAADKLQKPEREALKLAVDGLEKILHTFVKDGKVVMSSMIRNELFAEVNSLLQQTKTSLAQPAQEPVAWGFKSADGEIYDCIPSESHDDYEGSYNVPLYTYPPKREWVGLTDEEREGVAQDYSLIGYKSPFKEIEAKLKEKNT